MHYNKPITHIVLLLQLEYHNIVSFAHQIAKGMKYIADMKVRNVTDASTIYSFIKWRTRINFDILLRSAAGNVSDY